MVSLLHTGSALVPTPPPICLVTQSGQAWRIYWASWPNFDSILEFLFASTLNGRWSYTKQETKKLVSWSFSRNLLISKVFFNCSTKPEHNHQNISIWDESWWCLSIQEQCPWWPCWAGRWSCARRRKQFFDLNFEQNSFEHNFYLRPKRCENGWLQLLLVRNRWQNWNIFAMRKTEKSC